MRSTRQTIAIDLGSYRTRIYLRDKLVFDEPSLIAHNRKTGDIIALGQDAEKYLWSKQRDIRILSPLRRGRINDVASAETIIKYALRKVMRRPQLTRPRAMINIIGTATSAEKRALTNACRKAGAGNLEFIENTVAGALGAVLPIADSRGYGLLDIGHEKSECSIFAIGAKVGYSYIGYGGKDIIESVVKKIRNHHGLTVGHRDALQLIAHDHTKRSRLTVWGIDIDGAPAAIELEASQIKLYREQALKRIVNLVRNAFEGVSADLVADLFTTGITVAGGVAAMPGLDKILRSEVKIPFFIDPDASHTVCRGIYAAATSKN